MRAPRTALRALAALLASAAGCAGPGAPAPLVRGPLPARIQHPLALVSPSLRPRRAAVLPRGAGELAFSASYSSLYEVGTEGAHRVAFDAELARAEARVRLGLGRGLELEAELPFAHASGGFLDSFLEGLHSVLGLPNQGREDAEDDVFQGAVTSNGQVLYALEEGEVGLQDVPLFLTGSIVPPREDRWGAAWRLALELPAGSEADGFGNGEVEWGAGVLAEHGSGRWTRFASLGWIDVRESEAFEASDVHLRDAWELFGGLEYRWSDRLSLLGQIQLRTALTRDIDLEEIDQPLVDLGLGAAWDLSQRSRAFVSFHEDLHAESGPDFALSAGWSCSW